MLTTAINNKRNKKRNKQPHVTIISGWLIACCLMLASSHSLAQPDKPVRGTQLEVTPERCIALRKGQTCYLEVTFKWQQGESSDYCLINVTRNSVLKCWRNRSKGQYSFDFQSSKSNTFVLRSKNSNVDLAQAHIVVAWVYKSTKRSKLSWRLL
ncbi:MAG: DUF3019 domain-containing protein [Alteromonadaceae bacterium]|nr:DUF3019 domain-containing protein [Alteromonadaceae bacterium]